MQNVISEKRSTKIWQVYGLRGNTYVSVYNYVSREAGEVGDQYRECGGQMGRLTWSS